MDYDKIQLAAVKAVEGAIKSNVDPKNFEEIAKVFVAGIVAALKEYDSQKSE